MNIGMAEREKPNARAQELTQIFRTLLGNWKGTYTYFDERQEKYMGGAGTLVFSDTPMPNVMMLDARSERPVGPPVHAFTVMVVQGDGASWRQMAFLETGGRLQDKLITDYQYADDRNWTVNSIEVQQGLGNASAVIVTIVVKDGHLDMRKSRQFEGGAAAARAYESLASYDKVVLESGEEQTIPNSVDAGSLEQIFRAGRTRNGWTDRPVSDQQLKDLYDLVKMGPTSANCCPARFVWVKTAEAKARLARFAMQANQAKILAAPVTVIVGYDLDFPELLPTLNPARGQMMKAMFQDHSLKEVTALRNSSLQGGYLILAARAVGLDCGPMSGFDNREVDTEFFPGSNVKSNFICSLGYGSDEGLYPRNPRLSFEEAGRFA